MKVLDSDLLVAILRGKEAIKEVIERLDTEKIAITSISAFELYFGAFKSERAEENAKEVSDLISIYDILPFDGDVSGVAGRIYVDLQKQGKDIGIRDVMIAAICLINDAILVTRNVTHYSRIEGLKVEKW